MANLALFKVLVDGKACHGGDAKYPPVGVWTEDIEPTVCWCGWHLTTDPLMWWKPNCTLWLAEGAGVVTGDESNKAAFQRVRLLEQITADWKYLQMFPRVRLFMLLTAVHNQSVDVDAVNLQRADLSDASLGNINLRGADLSHANLRGADLFRAKLVGANLRRADLRDANVNCADFSWATLRDADLRHVDLSQVNLHNADLSGAFCPGNVPTGWKADARGFLI